MSERFKLIAEGLEVGPLLKRLEEKPDLWTARTDRQSYPGSAHQDTETIYLRWATDQSLAGGFYCLESEDHEETIRAFSPEVADLFCEVKDRIGFKDPIDQLNFDPGRVILVKLKPGGNDI